MGVLRNISDTARLLGFCSFIGRAGESSESGGDITEKRGQRSRTGVVYDLYEPIRDPLGTVVAVHGATLNGRLDQRLMQFARGLARARVSCLVPTIQGLGSCRFMREDLDEIESVILDAADLAEHAIGLVGFSYGGGYSLVAAARPSVTLQLEYVLTFGAHYSLKKLFDEYLENRHRIPHNELEWDNIIYLHLSLAYGCQKALGLSEGLSQKVEDLLHRYCHESSMEEKQQFYEEHLAERGVLERACVDFDSRVLEALSPKGRLGAMRCKIGLIHDRNDVIVPSVHAELIHGELVSSSCSTEQRMLITSLLSHVSLKEVFSPREAGRLLSLMKPLLSGEPRGNSDLLNT